MQMVFVKLLGVLALVAGLALTCLILPAAAVRRLTASGSRYGVIPVCALSAALSGCLIGYMAEKNTFWGFVFAWAGVYLLVCWGLTLALFLHGRRMYGKRYFVRYPKSIPLLACCGVLLVLTVGVAAVDRAGERFPAAEEIEAVWFGYTPLSPMEAGKTLSADYALLYPDSVCRNVEKYTGLTLTEEEVPALLENLRLTAAGVHTDAGEVGDLLSYCGALNRGFFRQRFCRSFCTTGEERENPYFYLVIRKTDGKCITRRYEYGSYSLESAALTDASADASEGLSVLQARVEYITPQVDEVSVRYRSGGIGGEQLLHYAEYEALFAEMQQDGLLPTAQEGDPSVNRMWVYVARSYALPPVYSAFGIAPRREHEVYDVSRSSVHTWNYLTALLKVS